VVVSVWEPALALAMTRAPDSLLGFSSTAPDPKSVAMIDGLHRDRATDAAAAGAELARTLGATVDPHPVPEELNIAETITGVAEQHGSSRPCSVRRPTPSARSSWSVHRRKQPNRPKERPLPSSQTDS
jgi:hypothetical protein